MTSLLIAAGLHRVPESLGPAPYVAAFVAVLPAIAYGIRRLYVGGPDEPVETPVRDASDLVNV